MQAKACASRATTTMAHGRSCSGQKMAWKERARCRRPGNHRETKRIRKPTRAIGGIGQVVQASSVLQQLDYFGTAAFALAGTVQAMEKGFDVVGCLAIATVTAVGGGTVRDLLLGNTPVFWIRHQEYLVLALVTSAVTRIACRMFPSIRPVKKANVLLDSIGLGTFAVIGTQVALKTQNSALVAVLSGLMTATFGGCIRDIILNRYPVLFTKELYGASAVAGSTTYLLALAHFSSYRAFMIGVLCTVLVRNISVTFDWNGPI